MLLMMQWRMKVMKKKGNTLLTEFHLCNPFSALLEVPVYIFWICSALQNKNLPQCMNTMNQGKSSSRLWNSHDQLMMNQCKQQGFVWITEQKVRLYSLHMLEGML